MGSLLGWILPIAFDSGESFRASISGLHGGCLSCQGFPVGGTVTACLFGATTTPISQIYLNKGYRLPSPNAELTDEIGEFGYAGSH